MMDDELVFYTNPMSRGRIVRWMLEEVGRPYRTELLDYGTTMKAPDYLAINPMGKVPALRHGETVVTEGAAICCYLADAFPRCRTGAAPGRPAARAVLSLAVLRRRAARGGRDATRRSASRCPPSARPWRATAASPTCYRRSRLRSPGARTWSATGSARPTSMSAPIIGWGMSFGTLEKRPVFERYFERLSSRPAAIRAREIDEALMPKNQPPASG